MNISQLPSYLIVLLSGGILLFLLAVGLIVLATARNHSIKPGLTILPLAILMIGFPGIKSFKGPGFEIDVAIQDVDTKARGVEENPDNPGARQELQAALHQLEKNIPVETPPPKAAESIARGHEALGNSEVAIKWANLALKAAPTSSTARLILDRARVSKSLPSDLTAPLSPAAHSNLAAATTQLSTHPNLSPEARVTLAKAQLILGHTNAAVTNLQLAAKANANIVANNSTLNRLLSARRLKVSPP